MISTEKKTTDVKNNDFAVEGTPVDYVKLTKIPEWLQGTIWKISGPYSKSKNIITIGSDIVTMMMNLGVDSELKKSAGGLTSFSIDSRYAVAITREFVEFGSYSFDYSSELNKQVEVIFKIDENSETGSVNILNTCIIIATFTITKQHSK